MLRGTSSKLITYFYCSSLIDCSCIAITIKIPLKYGNPIKLYNSQILLSPCFHFDLFVLLLLLFLLLCCFLCIDHLLWWGISLSNSKKSWDFIYSFLFIFVTTWIFFVFHFLLKFIKRLIHFWSDILKFVLHFLQESKILVFL